MQVRRVVVRIQVIGRVTYQAGEAVDLGRDLALDVIGFKGIKAGGPLQTPDAPMSGLDATRCQDRAL